jgi:predicted nucleic acid-binding protein
MEPVVVDSSVAMKWFVPENHSADARRILTGYQAGELTFLAPDLIYVEVGNVVWKKHRLQGLDYADA